MVTETAPAPPTPLPANCPCCNAQMPAEGRWIVHPLGDCILSLFVVTNNAEEIALWNRRAPPDARDDEAAFRAGIDALIATGNWREHSARTILGTAMEAMRPLLRLAPSPPDAAMAEALGNILSLASRDHVGSQFAKWRDALERARAALAAGAGGAG